MNNKIRGICKLPGMPQYSSILFTQNYLLKNTIKRKTTLQNTGLPPRSAKFYIFSQTQEKLSQVQNQSCHNLNIHLNTNETHDQLSFLKFYQRITKERDLFQ